VWGRGMRERERTYRWGRVTVAQALMHGAVVRGG
jgi:hypothetical protein